MTANLTRLAERPDSLEQLITEAHELEAAAAALAAQRAAPSQHGRIRRLAEQSLISYEASDGATSRTTGIELRQHDAPMGGVARRCAHELVELAEAIEGRRAEGARALTTAHIHAVHTRVLEDFIERNDVAEEVSH